MMKNEKDDQNGRGMKGMMKRRNGTKEIMKIERKRAEMKRIIKDEMERMMKDVKDEKRKRSERDLPYSMFKVNLFCRKMKRLEKLISIILVTNRNINIARK